MAEFQARRLVSATVFACVMVIAVESSSAVLAQTQSNPYAVGPGAAPALEGALNIWERRLVQEGLILLGFYNGFADGNFSKRTRDAIAAFQTKRGRPATGELTAVDGLALGSAALSLRKKLGWRSLDTATGMRMSYPAALLTNRTPNDGTRGEVVKSGDGHVSMMTVAIPDAAPDGIDQLYGQQLNAPTNRVTYKLRRGNGFILSGERQGGKFYARFEQQGREIRGYDLIWHNDADEMMQSVSVLISNGFYPFGDSASDGQPDYPTLGRLARIAEQGARQHGDQAETRADSSSGRETSAAANTADRANGLVERQSDALPPPTDGKLVTSDGKGLRFTYQYLPPENPDLRYAYQWATDTHLLSRIPEVDGLDGMLVFPRPLRYVAAQCGMVNAFYTKDKGAVVLCYELIDSITKMGSALAKGASDPKALTVEFVRNNLRFILLHESGHALIDLLDLPAVGREEDSVDQLAAVLLLSNADKRESRNEIARVLQLSATWFKVNAAGTKGDDVRVFADEHALDAQRYFNILCFVYGRDPENFHGIVDQGLLPKERAVRCPSESAKITRSWSRLLLPHFAPRFKPRDEASAETAAAPLPTARQERNPLEWDGKSNPFGN